MKTKLICLFCLLMVSGATVVNYVIYYQNRESIPDLNHTHRAVARIGGKLVEIKRHMEIVKGSSNGKPFAASKWTGFWEEVGPAKCESCGQLFTEKKESPERTEPRESPWWGK